MFKIPRVSLLEVLGRVSYGLSPKDTIEQSSCFVFDEGWVITYNDEITCRTQTTFPDTIHGAVDAVPLIRVLENLTDDEIGIETTAKEFQIHGNRSQSAIRLRTEIVLPVDQVESPKKWAPLPEDFGKAVEQVVGVTGRNEELFITVCVHLTPKWLEACDGTQAVRYELPLDIERNFLVRAKSLSPVGKLGVTKIGETEQWVHFRNKMLVYSCRRHLDKYPSESLSKMMNFQGEKMTLPQGAKEAAQLTGVFSGEDKSNDRIRVTLEEGRMVVRGEGNQGWAQRSLEMVYHGDPIQFWISPQMLTNLVKSYTDCEIVPGRLMVKGERWTFITLLGKVEAAEEAEPVAIVADAEESEGDEE